MADQTRDLARLIMQRALEAADQIKADAEKEAAAIVALAREHAQSLESSTKAKVEMDLAD
jgi:vacuolar-type H+-ATPase subunit E/Vma4